MDNDRGGDVLRLSEAFLGVRLLVAEPGNVEIIVALLDPPAGEAAEAPFLAVVGALHIAVRVIAKRLFELLELLPLERRRLAERRHVGAQIVNPDGLRVRAILLARA